MSLLRLPSWIPTLVLRSSYSAECAPSLQLSQQSRGVCCLVLEASLALVPLEGELDETVEELAVRDAGGLEEPRVEARRGEPRDRVQLVYDHLAVRLADEEVDPRH